MDVGALLAEARFRAHLSQVRLSAATGVGRSTLVAYERGRRSPTVATLDRLLAACGVQVRATLEPLLAELDARVDALSERVREFDVVFWAGFAQTLDDVANVGLTSQFPRAGPVRWAVDGSHALTLHGFAVPLGDVEVVVELDDACRFWLRAVQLRGVDAESRTVSDWLDADHDRIAASLGGSRVSALGMVRVRVVEELGPTLAVQVDWLERPVRVVSVEEVEATHPEHAEVLQRWRQRRSLSP